MRLARSRERQRGIDWDVRAAHRVARELDRNRGRAAMPPTIALRAAACGLDDPVDHLPEGAGNQDHEYPDQDGPNHWFVAGVEPAAP